MDSSVGGKKVFCVAKLFCFAGVVIVTSVLIAEFCFAVTGDNQAVLLGLLGGFGWGTLAFSEISRWDRGL